MRGAKIQTYNMTMVIDVKLELVLKCAGSGFAFHDRWQEKGRLLKSGSEGLSHWKSGRLGDPRREIEMAGVIESPLLEGFTLEKKLCYPS